MSKTASEKKKRIHIDYVTRIIYKMTLQTIRPGVTGCFLSLFHTLPLPEGLVRR